MKPDPLYVKQAKPFWANIRTISQHLGYTERRTKQIKVPNLDDIVGALRDLGLATSHVVDDDGRPTEMGRVMIGYFKHRAEVLDNFVRPRLMDVDDARALYEEWKSKLSPRRPPPMNKQKGEKKSPAYLTALVNMIVEANVEGFGCNYDPRELDDGDLERFPAPHARTPGRRGLHRPG